MSHSLHSNIRCSSSSSSSASPIPRLNGARKSNIAVLQKFEETKERIKKMFNNVELSVSSYDTAWVAMIPSNSGQHPFFPQCVNWLLENQHSDGSWGLPHRHPLLMKDALLSTLTSVLAMKRWGVGEEQIDKGLSFIEENIASAIDEKQCSPIGFEVIFPTMIDYAKKSDLNITLEPSNHNDLVHNRKVSLERASGSYSEGHEAYLVYISEGLGKPLDCERVFKYQRKNGSLFNSPSTTAVAFTNHGNADCLKYLCSVVDKFGSAVPTVYPLDIYARLSMVDNLQRLGIERFFKEEIRSVLDETYKYWLQGEECVLLDASTCAMAFRLLRVNGYDVSSDPLIRFSEDYIFNYLGNHTKDIDAILEIFRASEIIIHPNESILEKQNFCTSHFLEQELFSISTRGDKLNKNIGKVVSEALKIPFYANLERLASRRAIEYYDTDSTRILKTSYCSSNVRSKDFLILAVEDFNMCQSIHREELKTLSRWVVENRLDKLKFARQKLAYCYFSAAATLSSPELSDARISWAKNGVLTTVVDDFFDVGGSEEELVNLIQLLEKWDVDVSVDCFSEQVEIIYLALHGTISEIGEKAFVWQGRSVTNHIIEIWLDLLKSMLKEAQWLKYETVPTIDEYMKNGYISFALGPIVLPALYLVGPMLSEDVTRHPELHYLYKLMSTSGRLLNDIHGFKRESKEGKLNIVSLSLLARGFGSGSSSEEEIINEMKSAVNGKRRELLRLVFKEKDSIVPRACKDLFWKMSQVLHLFYANDDGFTSNEMINVAKAIIEEPIIENKLRSSEEGCASEEISNWAKN
ncbi:ent-kaurene synthase TSP4, chloroplastic isoform X1 [Cannabis sativa]|uniref:ent-kaurene synthase TSP4, chloroplastic isoform X1 n=3 Tax=Cannabis sativa TaxID=3483 RepID=UPI0029CA9A2B|nr:ent-kaurene synthase TSP4, chloroplastic isoform X1 [Cannabis sativa]XP_060970208.1 ent-kaurene synthase TSP4, chloroplastic isoform X1 [Cannabis sativa]XP_060970209.1 ent-kaurene synthase TSP4, chloroplastic isoform X1 [Cannabis sativa]XP_060970210.1 ent-kaurene synthase TSP4, chloroplastic isoform X1 [Cannabis sativa]XP_060970211.1 ent-kaurene synthase TSP4, chloroplastic isoform X1 [Cannabis sativa]XP_060970212.1 ent-kaurene synthase TSP4, chloroplastic isoform X1 [Cannabis sativa]